MPANLGRSQVIAGPYRATYEGLDMGVSRDGFTLNTRVMGEDIKSDITGDAIIDSLWQGIEMSISFTLNNWNAEAVQHLLWWFGDTLATADQNAARPGLQTRQRGQWGSTQRTGLSAWDYARPLELISCALLTAPNYIVMTDTVGYDQLITQSPQAMIFPKTLLRKDENYSLLFSSKARYVTLTLDVFPVDFVNSPATIVAGNYQRLAGCNRMTYFIPQFPTP